MKKNKSVAPILKWAGGKRQLLAEIKPLLPKIMGAYCEPFVGGGALLFELRPQKIYVNDINGELINVYEVIKNEVEALIAMLAEFKNESDYFYSVRRWDRDKEEYRRRTDLEKAARIIYLNKTCFNGLFRVNRWGEFNTPFGRYKKPKIVNAEMLRAVSSYLNEADVQFSSVDYAEVFQTLPNDAFVYLDPPYDPISDTSSFTGYAKGGFSRNEQIRLRECCDELHKRGLKFMLSNSATDFIKEQYADYNITIVKAKRAVNSIAAKRGAIDEVLVRNYE